MLRAKESTLPLLSKLGQALVQDMNDGGMGSLRFWRKGRTSRRFGGIAVKAEFLDTDGMLVMAAVILDHAGELYELDLFKGDFSALLRLPDPRDVRVDPVKFSIHQSSIQFRVAAENAVFVEGYPAF